MELFVDGHKGQNTGLKVEERGLWGTDQPPPVGPPVIPLRDTFRTPG